MPAAGFGNVYENINSQSEEEPCVYFFHMIQRGVERNQTHLKWKGDFMMMEEFSNAMDKIGCSAIGYQDVDVCIPVTIRPFGEVGNVKTHCEGKAHVKHGSDRCPGKPGEVCKFTISQKLRVEVPVVFGAKAEIGEASVECGDTEGGCGCDDYSDYEVEDAAAEQIDLQ